MPAVASGGSTVPATSWRIWNGRGSGSTTSTGIGLTSALSLSTLGLGAGEVVSPSPSDGWASCFSMPFKASAAFSRVGELTADFRKVPIFSESTR